MTEARVGLPKHERVQNLLKNEWLHLIAIEGAWWVSVRG